MERTRAERRKNLLKHENKTGEFKAQPHLKETIFKIGDGKRDRKLVAVKDPRSKSHKTQNGRDKNKHQDLEFTQAKSELTLLVRKAKRLTVLIRKLNRGATGKTAQKLEEISQKLKNAKTRKELTKVTEEIAGVGLSEREKEIRILEKAIKIIRKEEKQ